MVYDPAFILKVKRPDGRIVYERSKTRTSASGTVLSVREVYIDPASGREVFNRSGESPMKLKKIR